MPGHQQAGRETDSKESEILQLAPACSHDPPPSTKWFLKKPIVADHASFDATFAVHLLVPVLGNHAALFSGLHRRTSINPSSAQSILAASTGLGIVQRGLNSARSGE
jgi:hypothetical protein